MVILGLFEKFVVPHYGTCCVSLPRLKLCPAPEAVFRLAGFPHVFRGYRRSRSLSEIAEVVLWFGFVGIGFWSMLTEANAEQPAVEHRLRPGTGFYRRRGFFLSSSARFKHVA
jgi:hypothetical protein